MNLIRSISKSIWNMIINIATIIAIIGRKIASAFFVIGNTIYRGIKNSSLFLWDHIFIHIVHTIINIGKKIAHIITIMAKSIYKGVRASVIFLWDYIFSHIVHSIINVGKKVAHIITVIAKSIYKGVRASVLFLWDHVLIHIFIFFNKLGTLIFSSIKKVIQWVYSKLKPIFSYIKKILLFIKDIIKHVLIFIWDVLKQILTYIYDLLHFVYRGFEWTLIKIFHIIRFTWNQAIRFCEWFICRIKDFFILMTHLIKYGIRSLPNFIFNFLYSLWIYLLLLLHFIIYEIPYFVIDKMIIKFILKIWNLLIQFIKILLWNFIAFLRDVLFFMRIISRKVKRFFRIIFDKIYDLIGYYYLILLLPIMIPILLIISIVSSLHLICVALFLMFKVLFHIDNQKKYDLVYIKPLYLPSIQIVRAYQRYLTQMKYKNTSQKTLHNIWMSISIMIWQLIFVYLVSIFLSITFIPLTCLTFIYYAVIYEMDIKMDPKRFILKRISVLDITTGIFTVKKAQIYKKQITFNVKNECFREHELGMFVIKDELLQNISIELCVNQVVFQSYRVNVKHDALYILYHSYLNIEQQLISIKTPTFELPQIENQQIQIDYQRLRKLDYIENNIFSIRNDATQSLINLIITHKDSHLKIEKTVEINNIINPYLVEKLNLFDRTHSINNNRSFRSILDARLEYVFIEDDHIDSFGRIDAKEDKHIDISFYIKEIPEVIYTVNLLTYAKYRQIKIYSKQIHKPSINLKDKTINLTTNIINLDQTTRDITWFFEYQKFDETMFFETLYQSHLRIKNLKLRAMFLFNHSYTFVDFKITNPLILNDYYFKSMLYELTTNLPHIKTTEDLNEIEMSISNKYARKANKKNQNARYLYLPNVGSKYVKFIKWRSLKPKEISSSGKIHQKTMSSTPFRLTFYHNLFIRKTFNIDIEQI